MARTLVILFSGLLCAAQLQARLVEDQNGHTVEVPDQVQRVVSITIPLASMIMAVDEGPQRLAGMHKASRTDIETGLLGRIFPAARDIPYNMAGEGFVPNVEALAAQNPDVIFQWGDRGDDIVRPIRQLGLPVLTLNYGDSAYVTDWLRMVGGALGREQRAGELSRWFDQRMAEIEQQAAAQAGKPRALYLFRTRSGFQVAGANTSMGNDLVKAGAINVAAGLPGFAPVDIEQLLVWNPQLIFLNNFEPGLTPDELFNDPRLQGISAIQQQRVYAFPYGGFRWDPPSQETPLALDWLFSLIHPQQAQPGLRQRIREAYQLLYRYDAQQQDLDDLLKIRANAGSAHYQQLFGRDGL